MTHNNTGKTDTAMLALLPCLVAALVGCSAAQLGDFWLLYFNVLQKYGAFRGWARSLRRNAGKRHGKSLLLPVTRQR